MTRKSKQPSLKKRTRRSATRTGGSSGTKPKKRSSAKQPRTIKNTSGHSASKQAAASAQKLMARTNVAMSRGSQKSRANSTKKPRKTASPAKPRKRSIPRKPSGSRRRQISLLDRARASLRPKIRKPRKTKGTRKRVVGVKKIRRKGAKKTTKKGIKKSIKRVRRKRIQRVFRIFSDGQTIHVKVSLKTARFIGAYLSAVGRFLETNDVSLLRPFVGVSIKDTRGRVYPLETRPNVLYRLNAAVEPFEEIYRLVS